MEGWTEIGSHFLFTFFLKQATLPLTEKREVTPDDKKQARQFGF